MRGRLAVVAAAALATGGLGGTASADGGRDVVRGRAADVSEFVTTRLKVSAWQDAGAAHGKFVVTQVSVSGRFRTKVLVRCLAVTGTTARLGGVVTQSNNAFYPRGSLMALEVQDNGGRQWGTADAYRFGADADADCWLDSLFATIERGNLHVIDAPGV